jgi:hypothetical protein
MAAVVQCVGARLSPRWRRWGAQRWPIMCGSSVPALFLPELPMQDHPSGNLAPTSETRPDRQSLVFGLKHPIVPGASLVARLAAPLFAIACGWRAAFMPAGILAVVVAVLILRAVTEFPVGSPHETSLGDAAPFALRTRRGGDVGFDRCEMQLGPSS